MQFFKHYHNARKTPVIREIMKTDGKEGYFHYMALLEILCEKFDGQSETISLHIDDLFTALEIKQRKKLDDFLDKLNQVSLKVWEEVGKVSVKKIRVSENFYFFEAPILMDLKDRDFKNARSVRAKAAPKNKEEREKNKEKRIKREEREEISPVYFESKDRLNFAQIVDLFNSRLGGLGKIKHENHLQTGSIVADFAKHSKTLSKKSDWDKVFGIVMDSDFITQKLGVRSHLAWILKEDNVQRILNGDFSNKKKSDALEIENPYGEAVNG